MPSSKPSNSKPKPIPNVVRASGEKPPAPSALDVDAVKRQAATERRRTFLERQHKLGRVQVAFFLPAEVVQQLQELIQAGRAEAISRGVTSQSARQDIDQGSVVSEAIQQAYKKAFGRRRK